MKSTANRVGGTLLALTLLMPTTSLFAAPPAPGPNELVIQTEIENLFFQTIAIADASGFTQGERTSLAAKLVRARAAVIRGNNNAALGELAAFINEVNSLEQSGRLSIADAALLRNQAVLISSQIASSPV